MEATPLQIPMPPTLTPAAARTRILGSLSVRALARKVGISHSYLVRLLRGQRRPLAETAKLIADQRGLTLDGFYSLLQVAVKREEQAKAPRARAGERKRKTRRVA